ncbi:tRNA/rRNA methyltransferase [Tribonema minus]|uniref:tRNA/rRNA methyltransferase n=1 Tax=Tribonema minus TaxID=303371 RepID=A0A835Z4A7_9STRA|nr:tRNA/rRNA methyltransferase [Tribonema minus]
MRSTEAFELWRPPGSGDLLDITSPTNPRIKTLHKRKSRDSEGRVLVEGCRLVTDALKAGLSPDLVLVSPEALASPGGSALSALLQRLSSDVVCLASGDCVARACDTVSPQGVVAVVARPLLPLPETVRLALVLDGVSDPGNMGTMVRTAAALGVDAVVMTGACVDLWSPKALRASMGAAFRVPSVATGTWRETRELLQARGLALYAADGGAATAHWEVPWSKPSALVVGSEAEGLSQAAREDLDRGVITGIRIPLSNGVESLNAAVAGAIVLGEAQRQRQHGVNT